MSPNSNDSRIPTSMSNSEGDEELAVRPRLSRNDNAHKRSPLVTAAYRVEPEGELREVSIKEAIAGQKKLQQQQQQPPPQFWVDVEIQGPVDAALPLLHETILDHLDLAKATRFLRKILNDQTQWQTPQVLPLRDATFIVMRILDVVEGKVRHAAALCLRHTVVTVTSSNRSTSVEQQQQPADEKQQRPPEQQQEQQQQRVVGISVDARRKKELSILALTQHDTLSHMLERELAEATVSGCVLLWLGFHVQRSMQCVHQLREQLYELAERTSQDVCNVEYPAIALCKDVLLRIAAVAEEQNECVQAVAEGDAVSEGITFDSTMALTGSLNVLKQSAATTERLCYRLEKRLTDIEHAYDANQQNRINHRLNVLTIFSAIFMPLTLIAGIYGQNFKNMPELEYENAYFIVLGTMVVLAVTMLLFFYKNGWLS